ncbi:hypothetical protein [Coleofasciculus sp. FACHB-125]|jgi:hypothetical protein|uniref:hypothetical protein n=2 Tax=Cyanobacteriota TaxID=1117 RepID=UPI001F54DA20|nr:hypothetical protein [Coleofasciculus sp. FACHB-125]
MGQQNSKMFNLWRTFNPMEPSFFREQASNLLGFDDGLPFPEQPSRSGSSMMKFLQPNLRKHLLSVAYAVALVGSLAAYQRTVMPKPLSVAQKHWAAIATENPERTVTQYSDNAILMRSYGVLDEVYQGKSIYPAWEEFFSKYKIQDFQVVKQQQRDRAVEAVITIYAKSKHGTPVVLSLSYQVQFDKDGKIIREVWQANPELSV